MQPTIYRINRKPQTKNEFGLRKTSFSSSKINFSGLIGDYNNFRKTKKNNHPDMAIMLLSMDIINNLNKEGWPVQPGDLGENLTIKNIKYDNIKPSQIYKIGSARIKISIICAPCYKLESLDYVGKKNKNIFIKTLINRRGWYAKVLREGLIRTGDSFEIIN